MNKARRLYSVKLVSFFNRKNGNIKMKLDIEQEKEKRVVIKLRKGNVPNCHDL
jgi:hypothetical protein